MFGAYRLKLFERLVQLGGAVRAVVATATAGRWDRCEGGDVVVLKNISLNHS